MVQADDWYICCIHLSGNFLTSFYSFNSSLSRFMSCLYVCMLVPIYHFHQEILEAFDDAARKYYEETPKEDMSNITVIAVMRAATKNKQQSFKGQFTKYFVIANPKFRDKFLQEVSSSYHIPLQCILIQYWLKNNIPCASFRSRSTGATTRSLRWFLRNYTSLLQHLLLHLSMSNGLSNGTQASTLVKLSTFLLRDSLIRTLNPG